MHKTRSADVRMIALIGSAVALAGCMTAGYVVGSVDSAFKGQYQQSAMLNLGLRIDGILYSLHAPVGCRSFVHPIGGMRVTRDSGGLFEFKLQNGGLAYLQIPYSCAESNAEIGFTVSNLVSLYRVAQTPSVTVTRDWAVPPAYAEFEAAQVALTNASFSHDLKTFDANVSVVETILGT